MGATVGRIMAEKTETRGGPILQEMGTDIPSGLRLGTRIGLWVVPWRGSSLAGHRRFCGEIMSAGRWAPLPSLFLELL